MKLHKVEVCNYRQFEISTTIKFDDNTTILAGSNNSGKTSLIELIKSVFSSGSLDFTIDDLPVTKTKQWVDNVYASILDVFSEKQTKEERVIKILLLMNPEGLEFGINVNAEVRYSTDEDIRRFADYLMDLTPSSTSFYFRYEFSPVINILTKWIEESYENLEKEVKKLLDLKESEEKEALERKKRFIKGLLMKIYIKSFKSKYYFTDSEYKNKVSMDVNEFKSLFNIYFVDANTRLADDEINSRHSISHEMVNYVSKETDWMETIENLPDNLVSVIEETELKDSIKEKSLKGLEDVIREIASTNGGVTARMQLDFDIDNDSVKRFIQNITRAKFAIDDYLLNETAQGLGYSNLILIHLKLENYLQKVDSSTINLFIIEEPEVHMHPQMQKVFIKYLFEYYKSKNIQGLLTTHSNEMVKATEMDKIRVIRKVKEFQNKIFDMNTFLNEIDKENQNLRKFYSLFFNINFSEMIFADRIIMFEGDTERMYIQRLLAEDDFKDLDKLYISYVQVGGAYAHMYKDIIEYLNIRTVIFTDIDYKKGIYSVNDILESESSNSSINSFYGAENTSVSIKDIYEWEEEDGNQSEAIRIQFQTKEDNYTRTLEEAMLAKYLSINSGDSMCKKCWERIRDKHKLKFSIPRKEDEIYVHDIVESTSNKKTDFMYSVIEQNYVLKMLPNYIEEGLEWLKQ